MAQSGHRTPHRRTPGKTASQNNPALKDADLYDTLRSKGMSKEKAARISNAHANPHLHPSEKGGKAPRYEEWTKHALYRHAQEIGLDGRSGMTKPQLIKALRRH
ncbi:Rho termination factor [Thioclava sp. GXIMD4216]|uniref:DUF7218 family protein n=1 Tax=Thioclava sp. GXIMD4216 TaxID=3131929 RepID=UPI0030CEBB6C